MDHPTLPSLDDMANSSIPDNVDFSIIAESPQPGYLTDENEPVSPSR